jgi:hypothetical protein
MRRAALAAVAAVFGCLGAPAIAIAVPVRGESWTLGASAGFEASPDSAGEGLEALGLFGISGTARFSESTCLDVRLGLGATEDGSELVSVSETRVRLDVRPAFCPALHRAVTLLFAVGPAAGLSLHEARVGTRGQSYSAFDFGVVGDVGVLLRAGPVLFRFDVEGGVLRRFVFGLYAAVGAAI